jgi:hypothetical protein
MSICMCDIPFNRSILHLSNCIRHVMPSSDRKLELTAKASMAQPVSQPAVCSNGLSIRKTFHLTNLIYNASTYVENVLMNKNKQTFQLHFLRLTVA